MLMQTDLGPLDSLGTLNDGRGSEQAAGGLVRGGSRPLSRLLLVGLGFVELGQNLIDVVGSRSGPRRAL